jgi:virulence factor Mce-like protein
MTRPARTFVATILFTALVASGCSFIGGGSGHYRLIAYFPRAVALYKSSQVRVLGLPGGTVEAIDVEGDRVKVTMSMDEDVPVPEDVEALIAPQSLIGERYIQLSPAWREGQEKAPDGMEVSKTVIPVEPDEALAELKKFLDSLNPEGLGRLVDNLSTDLQGQGPTLNHALDQISQVVGTFAEKDQQLAEIVDHFDRFTATLVTRESQLGDILATFAQATQVLADERNGLENLLGGLADLSRDGLTLVSKHSQQLRTDLDTLTRLAQSIDVNIGTLGQLLDSGPLLTTGILGAYNPQLRAFNLRENFGPIASELLAPLTNLLGLPPVCLPVFETCSNLQVQAQATGAAAPIDIKAATTPVDDLLALLGSAQVRRPAGPSNIDRVADGASGIGGFLRSAAGALVGAS